MATAMYRSSLLKIGAMVLGGLAVLALPQTHLAQAQSGGKGKASKGHVCMERDGTSPGAETSKVKVKVPKNEEQKLTGRGFVRSNCGGAVKWMKTTGPSMCALADIKDPAFVSEFLNTHGLTPAEICDLATRLPGGN